MNREPLGVRILRATWLCATIAFALLLLAAPAHAAFPGKNGKIVFMGNGNGGPNIFSINPDGSGKTPLGTGYDPAWSPDGKKLAFSSLGTPAGLSIMNADGSDALPVPNTGSRDVYPAWSPDGKKLAFTREGNCSDSGCDFSLIYTINVDGTGLAALAPNNYFDELRPAWSPDGTEIAFDALGGIFTVHPDGTDLREIIFPAIPPPEPNPPRSYDNYGPSWSPDGSRLAYGGANSAGVGIFAANYSNSTYARGQTELASFGFATSNTPRHIVWSPDGTKIAFDLSTCTSTCPNPPSLYVMNQDGSGQTNITTDEGQYPDWQPLPITYYPRPKGATPFQTYLTVAYKLCTSANEQHGAPLSSNSCSPPQQTSDYLTVGTLDSNGQKANAIGSVRYDVKVGSLVVPADVKIAISVTDVRNKSDLSDYTGELQETSLRRITDKDSTPAPDGTTEAATVTDIPFSATVPCTATSDTTVGSTCTLTTTANALVPGQVIQGMRSIWQLSQVQLYDGGADGQASTTADNTLFMDEGIFAP